MYLFYSALFFKFCIVKWKIFNNIFSKSGKEDNIHYIFYDGPEESIENKKNYMDKIKCNKI